MNAKKTDCVKQEKVQPKLSTKIKYCPSRYIPNTDITPTERAILAKALAPFSVDSEKHLNPGDVCCIALICMVHRRLALIDIENKGLFLPYVTFKYSSLCVMEVFNELLHKIIDLHAAGMPMFTHLPVY